MTSDIKYDRDGRCTGCGWDQPDVPHACGIGAIKLPALTVYVLTAEINGPSFDPEDLDGSDYSGITTVHATLDGALAKLDAWLEDNGIDRDVAHWDEQRSDTFIGNDVELEMPPGRLNWGINKTEVQA